MPMNEWRTSLHHVLDSTDSGHLSSFSLDTGRHIMMLIGGERDGSLGTECFQVDILLYYTELVFTFASEKKTSRWLASSQFHFLVGVVDFVTAPNVTQPLKDLDEDLRLSTKRSMFSSAKCSLKFVVGRQILSVWTIIFKVIPCELWLVRS